MTEQKLILKKLESLEQIVKAQQSMIEDYLKTNIPDKIGTSEASRILGVTPGRVHQLLSEAKINGVKEERCIS